MSELYSVNNYCIRLKSLVKSACVTGINMMIHTIYTEFVDLKIGCQTTARTCTFAFLGVKLLHPDVLVL